jgi:hypothetical protein
MSILKSSSSAGERRFAPTTYKVLLTSHILVSVAWLGVALSKFVLALVAATTSSPDSARALYSAMEVLNVVFPPLVIATLASGVVLTLGTRWGLLDYYWALTKLGLSVAVFTSGAQFSSSLAQQSIAALAGATPARDSAPGDLLLALFAAHTLMLGVATVVSVFKPWGLTWFGRGGAVSRLRPPSGRRLPSAQREASGTSATRPEMASKHTQASVSFVTDNKII